MNTPTKETPVKKPLLSGPTRVATTVFLVVGLFSLVNSLGALQKLPPNETEIRTIYILSAIWGVASLITWDSLQKGRKWAYISGFILLALLFSIHGYTYYAFKTLNIVNLAVGVVTLILLILGRKDFANK